MGWLFKAMINGFMNVAGAVIGGAVGAVSQVIEESNAEKQKENEDSYIETEKANILGVEGDDTQPGLLAKEFALQQQEAEHTAEVQDINTTQNEKDLSKNTNLRLKQLSLQNMQFGEQLANQNAALGQSYGASLSGLAQSGVRNSSVAQAVDLQAAQSRSQIDSLSQLQNESDRITLSGIMNDFGSGTFQSQQARDSSNYIRDSYRTGGIREQAYQLQRESYLKDFALQQTKLDDEWDIWNNGWARTGRFLSAVTTGASTGLKLGTDIQTLSQKKWGNLG